MRLLAKSVLALAIWLSALAPAWAAQTVSADASHSAPVVSEPGALVVTLNDAIAMALRGSPDLLPAQDQVTLAGIQQHVAQSEFGLKITPSFRSGSFGYGLDQQALGVSLSKQLTTGTQIALLADASRWNGGASEFRDGGYALRVTQPLLKGFGPTATAGLETARRGTERSGRRLSETRQQTVVSVADAYFSILRYQRLVLASELGLERARFLSQGSAARAKVGLATQLDVLRAELLASRSEADLEMQREALATAFDQLKLIVGRSPESPLGIVGSDVGGDPFGLERYASRPVEELVSIALRTRPDIQESRDRIDDAERDRRVAQWNTLPDVSLSLSYAQRGLGSFDSAMVNNLFGGWRVGFSSSFPLDQAAQTAAVATAGIGVRAAERDVVQAERRVALDVRRAHRVWRRAGDSISIQRKAVDMAERQLRLARLRYERGIANNFDVVDAEQQVLQTQVGLITAETERELAGLRLLRAIGMLDPGAGDP